MATKRPPLRQEMRRSSKRRRRSRQRLDLYLPWWLCVPVASLAARKMYREEEEEEYRPDPSGTTFPSSCNVTPLLQSTSLPDNSYSTLNPDSPPFFPPAILNHTATPFVPTPPSQSTSPFLSSNEPPLPYTPLKKYAIWSTHE
ncbi:uncharacterized protein LOC144872719 [Branchiostoma floridae x Branchiostoma japonicum]